MTLRVSTKARNAMLGDANPSVALLVANTISFDSASKEIRDSGNSFISSGFVAGDSIAAGGTTGNNGTFTATSVAAGVIVVSEAVTDEAAGTVFGLSSARGGSLRDIFQNGIINVYSGSQPENADAATNGTLLLSFSVGGGAFSAGSETNGLELGTASDGEIEKSDEVWSAKGLAEGTSAWFRMIANDTDNGLASTTLPRIDGTVGTSGADLIASSTAVAVDATYTIDKFKFTLPYQYGA